MKFFTLVALVGYTSAIRLAGPNGTIHSEGTFDPPAPTTPPATAGPVAVAQQPNMSVNPNGTSDTPYVAPNYPYMQNQPQDQFAYAHHTPVTPYVAPAPATPPAVLAQGPNGTIHSEGTFDPPAPTTPPATAGPVAVAQQPNMSVSPDGTSATPYVAPDFPYMQKLPQDQFDYPHHPIVARTMGAALAQIAGPNGTVHVDGTFDPPAAAVVAAAPSAASVAAANNIHPGTTLIPYVAPVALAQNPNGNWKTSPLPEVRPDFPYMQNGPNDQFAYPLHTPVTPYTSPPAAPVTAPVTALAQGPNGTIHSEGTFDPPAPTTPAATTPPAAAP